MKVAIVGAGAAGLGIGWRLAKAGVEVHVFDAGAAGGAATWAAAGMLTPWTEDGTSPLAGPCIAALGLWPNYCEELEAASGVDLILARHGTLRVAVNPDEASLLRGKVELHQRQGVAVEWVNDRPDFLSESVVAVARYADEAQIENRNLGPALAKAFVNAGGNLHEGEPIVRVLIANDRLLGVETDQQRLSCDVVVIAAGAWSGRIEGLPLKARPPVIPRKGQILSLASGQVSRPFDPLVGTPAAYAAPRTDGRVVIGATLEDTGFETQLDRAAIDGLAAKLRIVLKGADTWPIAEVWSGLRPGTPDNLPILGGTSVDGLYLATGQFRDGILLTPWIADMISSQIMSGRAPDGLVPFSIARFHGGLSK